MQAIISNLMAVMLLIHAVIGCCWHHAHDCSKCDKVVAAAEPSNCSCNCHRKAEPRAPQSPCPQNGKGTCHSVCTYLSPQRASTEDLSAGQLGDVVVPLDMLVGAQFRNSLASAAVDRPGNPRLAGQPVRVHLLNQVFLI